MPHLTNSAKRHLANRLANLNLTRYTHDAQVLAEALCKGSTADEKQADEAIGLVIAGQKNLAAYLEKHRPELAGLHNWTPPKPPRKKKEQNEE